MILNLIKKILIITLLLNICQNFSYATQINPLILNKPFFLPSNLGLITEEFNGNKGQRFIIIKDLHCNLDLQKNTYEIIKILRTTHHNRLNKIFVEGSTFSQIDTSLIRDIQDPLIKNKILNYYFNQGDLTGPEIFNILERKKFNLFGIEDLNVYIKNFENLYSMLQYQFSLKQIVDEKNKLLNNKINIINNSNLCELIKKDDENLKFIDSFNFLTKFKNPHNYPELQKILYINKQKQNFNLPIIKLEATYVIQCLKSVFSEQELNDLQNYSDILFFNYLNHLIKKHCISIDQIAPNLTLYLKFLNNNEIDVIKAYEELESFKQEVFNDATKVDLTAQKFWHCKNFLKALDAQINGKASVIQLEFLMQQENIMKFYGYSEKFNLKIPVILFRQYLSDLTAFYQTANKRNEVFMKNIQKIHHKINSFAIIFTGGYHIKGLTEILRNQDYSYTVITPNVGEKSYSELYEQKINKLSNWIFKEKIQNNTLALPSTFIYQKETMQKKINSSFQEKLKFGWRNAKWETFGIFIYTLSFVATIIAGFLFFGFGSVPLIIWLVPVLLMIFTIIWTYLVFTTNLKNKNIIRHTPKIATMILSILAIIIFPTSPIALVIFLSYIFADICNSYLNLADKLNSQDITKIMITLYLMLIILKLATLPFALLVPIIIAIFLLGTLAMVSYLILKDKISRHWFRLTFVLLNIGFMIFNISADASAFSGVMANLASFTNYFSKIIPAINYISKTILDNSIPSAILAFFVLARSLAGGSRNKLKNKEKTNEKKITDQKMLLINKQKINPAASFFNKIKLKKLLLLDFKIFSVIKFMFVNSFASKKSLQQKQIEIEKTESFNSIPVSSRQKISLITNTSKKQSKFILLKQLFVTTFNLMIFSKQSLQKTIFPIEPITMIKTFNIFSFSLRTIFSFKVVNKFTKTKKITIKNQQKLKTSKNFSSHNKILKIKTKAKTKTKTKTSELTNFDSSKTKSSFLIKKFSSSEVRSKLITFIYYYFWIPSNHFSCLINSTKNKKRQKNLNQNSAKLNNFFRQPQTPKNKKAITLVKKTTTNFQSFNLIFNLVAKFISRTTVTNLAQIKYNFNLLPLTKNIRGKKEIIKMQSFDKFIKLKINSFDKNDFKWIYRILGAFLLISAIVSLVLIIFTEIPIIILLTSTGLIGSLIFTVQTFYSRKRINIENIPKTEQTKALLGAA